MSSVYTLTSSVLSKVGAYERARLTADRARTWAEVSGSPLASAAAARELAIVLRHQDRHGDAQRLMSSAATDVEATGLRTDAAAAAYAQMLCTLAYTAARGGQRAEALAMVEEARHSARRLPGSPPPGRLFPISPAAVDLYAVGVHWALGDSGAALEAGKDLRPDQFTRPPAPTTTSNEPAAKPTPRPSSASPANASASCSPCSATAPSTNSERVASLDEGP